MRAGVVAGARRRTVAPAVPNVLSLSLPGGDVENPISTPHSASFPTASLDLRFKGTVEESNPTSRVFFHKAGDAFRLSVTWNHLLRLQWRNATGFQLVNATVAHGVALGTVASLRAVLRSNGGTGSEILFYKSADWNPATDAGTWTQIGTTIASVQSPTLVDSGGALHVGGRADVAGENLDTEMQYASIRPYLGAEVASLDPTKVASTGPQTPASYTDVHGNAWTISGSTWAWVTA